MKVQLCCDYDSLILPYSVRVYIKHLRVRFEHFSLKVQLVSEHLPVVLHQFICFCYVLINSVNSEVVFYLLS